MVDRIDSKPVTLGAMVLKAQKKAAETLANPLSGALDDNQKAVADQVSLSEPARARLSAARKVEGYLRVFGSFLKLLNAPQYGISPTKYGLEQNLGSTKKTSFQKDV